MTILDMDPEGVRTLADKLAATTAGIRETIEVLDRDITEAEPAWAGDAPLAFRRFYQEWRKGVMTHADALKKTADHLHELVDQQQKIM